MHVLRPDLYILNQTPVEHAATENSKGENALSDEAMLAVVSLDHAVLEGQDLS